MCLKRKLNRAADLICRSDESDVAKDIAINAIYDARDLIEKYSALISESQGHSQKQQETLKH